MRAKRRFVDMDPADRQIASLKIGAYSGSIFCVVVILIAWGSQKKLLVGLITAGIFLAITMPLDYWMVRRARRRQAMSRLDPPNGQSTYSRRS